MDNMDSRTVAREERRFVWNVYNIFKPFPNAIGNVSIVTNNYRYWYDNDLKKIGSRINEYGEPIKLYILNNIWMVHPEVAYQVCLEFMNYLKKTHPIIEKVYMVYRLDKNLVYSFYLYTENPIHAFSIDNETNSIEIPLNETNATIQSMIFQTISTWKTLSINVVYNPDKKEIPYTDEECRILSIFKQDYGDDTCWANTVINAFLISRNMQKIAITYLQTYMNDVVNRLSIEKQEVFYNPDRICILPKKLMSDTAERFSIMQFVYKSLCYFSKTIHERNTDPSLKWNMHVARTFNDTERSFVSKLLRLLPGEVGIVAWAIRGFLQNIYGRELYPTKVMTDVSYKKIITGQVHINPDVEIILTDVVRDFPMEEKVVFNDEVFWLDHVALFLYEIGKFHYMTGVFCNNEPYIIDTNDFNGIYKADWVNGNFWEIKQRYKTNKIRISYACYIKEISYDREPDIDCLKNASVGKRIVRERIVKEQLAQLPPIRWSSRRV